MPGGQFTNLKEQARSLGLDTRWHEVAKAYRAANDLFGDIVKVTPSSKVVGDMALMMVSQGLTPQDVVAPDRDIAFPASVVEMLRGDLGQPPGGWPKALQHKALKGAAPITVRPGSLLGSADLPALRLEAAKACGRTLTESEFAAYLMYPKVFTEFSATQRKFGPVSVLPTSVFFYGMKAGDEVTLEIEDGKALVVVLTAIGDTRDDGQVEVFFELNGQPRVIAVPNRATMSTIKARRKAEDGNSRHVAAPMPGVVSTINIAKDQTVKAGDVLLTLEAMKMETVLHATQDGIVAGVLVGVGSPVDSKDLLIELK
jgi:pyruvate carboxylase